MFKPDIDSGKRLDAVIRRETQNYVTRREEKFISIYFSYLSLIIINLTGWVWTQIIDYYLLSSSKNAYYKIQIWWHVNNNLRYVLYFLNFGIWMGEALCWILLNAKFLIYLKTKVDKTFQMYYKTIIITFLLEWLAEILLAIYVYPFSSDRYGMMELTNKGDRPLWTIIDIFWDMSIILFLFYFTLYMRFSVIHKNMEKKQFLYKSVFYNEKFDQLDDKVYIRDTLENQEFVKSVQTFNDSDSSSIRSNESDSKDFLFSDRREYTFYR